MLILYLNFFTSISIGVLKRINKFVVFDTLGLACDMLSLGHLSSFRITGVRVYDELSTIYTSFKTITGQQARPVDVISH